MCFLGVFCLGLVGACLGWQCMVAVAFGYVGTQLLQRILCKIDRVGSHIGDQTHGIAANVHAFIQLLCHAHGAAGGEAKLARGLLLQC